EVVRDGAPGPWPPGVPRNVAVYVNQEDTALQLCLGGELVAVLPEIVAAQYVDSGQLVRLRVAPLRRTTLYTARPAHAARDERLDALAHALREHLSRRSTSPSAWRLGDQLLLRADYAAALRAYRSALSSPAERAPDDYHLRVARVSLHLGQQRALQAACDRARVAAKRQPLRLAAIDALRALGYCYAGDLGRAERT